MLKQVFKIKREYDEAKEAAFHQVVNNLESRNNKFLVIFFFIFIVVEWLFSIFTQFGLEKLSNSFGWLVLFLPLISSYFFFYLGSKLIFKPTEEEILDDTTLLAIFSGCNRKETRALISAGLSIFHTVIFIFYLIYNDFGFPFK